MSQRSKRLASDLREYRDSMDEFKETGSRDAERRAWNAGRNPRISEAARKLAVEESAGRLEDHRARQKELFRRFGVKIGPQEEK